MQNHEPSTLPTLLPVGFTCWPDFQAFHSALGNLRRDWSWIGQQEIQAQLQRHLPGVLRAICAHCETVTELRIEIHDEQPANWRETLRCERCGLINRWRLAIHLFQLLSPKLPEKPIYITEQLTPLFSAFRQRYPEVIGSEYHGPDCQGGQIVNHHGIPTRHEDVTALSLEDASVSLIGCFDVLEHVPDYLPSLAEFHRVLEPGGTLVISVPMNLESETNIARAVIDPDGSIRHLLEPQYHGDPVRAEGVLCYHEFGWELLDQLRAAGFTEAVLWTVWAPEFGYLGSFQPFYIARKGS